MFKVCFFEDSVIERYSQTLLYGHPLNTDTSLLWTRKINFFYSNLSVSFTEILEKQNELFPLAPVIKSIILLGILNSESWKRKTIAFLILIWGQYQGFIVYGYMHDIYIEN